MPSLSRTTARRPPRIRVDFYSDIACPWCYVGMRRLDAAIGRWSAAPDCCPVDVKWYPFVIDHGTQQGGEEYMAYNVRRWGSDTWTEDLRRTGRADGALFENWKTWPNTLKAHQLIRLADAVGGPAKSAEAEHLLFVRTYEEGGNVSLDSELEAVGVRLGLPLDDVRQALTAGTYVAEVLALDGLAKERLKISGVPFFIIGASCEEVPTEGSSPDEHSNAIIDLGRSSATGALSKQYGLNGAQPVEKLLQYFERVLLEVQEGGTGMGGERGSRTSLDSRGSRGSGGSR